MHRLGLILASEVVGGLRVLLRDPLRGPIKGCAFKVI